MGGCLPSLSRAPKPAAGEEAEESTRSPRCVALEAYPPDAGAKRPAYLCCDAQAGASGGRPLRLGGAGSPCARFRLEPSRVHGGLVHVRCCYDNSYWAAQPARDGGGWVVAAAADEAEEDRSTPACTLFRTTRAHTPGSIRLLHVHLDMYVCVSSSSDDTTIKLEALGTSLHGGDEQAAMACSFTVHDLSQSLVLPRHVVFKGDNGKYLRARTVERHAYIQFSGAGAGDKAALHTVHANGDGTFRVRCSRVGKFWRRSPNWIWADSHGGDADSGGDTLFQAVGLPGAGGSGGGGAVVVALRNMGNGFFCKRLTTEGKRNCLNAGAPTITADARLQVEEPVAFREIYNVVFDLSRPRVYGRSAVTMAAAAALNGTTSSNTARLVLEDADTEKRTWASTVTLKLAGVATSIRAGAPVIVADGGVEVSSEFTGAYGWGSTAEKEAAPQKVVYEVTVPPRTRVTVASTATRASCDVPFSYTQRDTLVDGTVVTYDMDDGLYTGVNCYDFKYVTTEESILDS